ncbi:hypothetical protein BJL95_00795 [Methylomonas sp. LWB]|nr:hypothetical protein BJL95_00795 [Methylomonas sp. LWB]
MLVISAGIAEIQTPRTELSLPYMALDACIPADMTALLKSDKVELFSRFIAKWQTLTLKLTLM